MKIIFVTTYLDHFGGGGKFLMDYANKLCSNGHEISIVAQSINNLNYKFHKKISIINLGGPVPSNPLHWLKLKKIKTNYLNILNKLDFDIVMSTTFPVNYFCANIKKSKDKIKHVLYCHEPHRFFHDKEFYSNTPYFSFILNWMDEKLLKNQITKKKYFLLNDFILKNDSIRIIINCFLSWLIRALFKKYDLLGTLLTDEIISNSKFTKKRVKQIYGRSSYLCYPIVNMDTNHNKSENFELRQELMVNKDTPIIFTLGLTHHMKGAEELIIIFQKILTKIPSSILLIGGWIEKKNHLLIKDQMEKLKIPKNNVFFYGFIKKELLNDFYAQSTLTFYTALDEPFGIIPIESMKNGTPVIAFNRGGPSETILDGKTGFLIKNKDYQEFAQKSIQLITDKMLYEKFSTNAKQYVKKKYNFEENVSNFTIILKRIISKN